MFLFIFVLLFLSRQTKNRRHLKEAFIAYVARCSFALLLSFRVAMLGLLCHLRGE